MDLKSKFCSVIFTKLQKRTVADGEAQRDKSSSQGKREILIEF